MGFGHVHRDQVDEPSVFIYCFDRGSPPDYHVSRAVQSIIDFHQERSDMPITYRFVDSKGELLASGDTIGYLKGLVANLDPGTTRSMRSAANPDRANAPAGGGESSSRLRMG
jgi:hypothetical protein